MFNVKSQVVCPERSTSSSSAMLATLFQCPASRALSMAHTSSIAHIHNQHWFTTPRPPSFQPLPCQRPKSFLEKQYETPAMLSPITPRSSQAMARSARTARKPRKSRYPPTILFALPPSLHTLESLLYRFLSPAFTETAAPSNYTSLSPPRRPMRPSRSLPPSADQVPPKSMAPSPTRATTGTDWAAVMALAKRGEGSRWRGGVLLWGMGSCGGGCMCLERGFGGWDGGWRRCGVYRIR